MVAVALADIVPTSVVPVIEREMLESARRHCPVRTGATRDSLDVHIKSLSPYDTTIELTGSPVVNYIVGGTSPHDIYPRNAQALHWTGPAGDVFAAHVRHPGTQPNNFLREVADDLKPTLTTEGEKVLRAWTDTIKSRFS